MKHITKISEGEKEILYCNFCNVNKEELISGLTSAIDEISSMNRTDLLIIFDITGTFFDKESFSVAIDFAKNLKAYRKKSALVGITGGKKYLLSSLLSITQTSSFVKSFENLEDAKRWVVS